MCIFGDFGLSSWKTTGPMFVLGSTWGSSTGVISFSSSRLRVAVGFFSAISASELSLVKSGFSGASKSLVSDCPISVVSDPSLSSRTASLGSTEFTGKLI